MKRVLNLIVALTVIVASIGTVNAGELDSSNNWYFKAGLGYSEQIDDYSETNFNATEWDFDGGINGSLAGGYAAKYWALEGEVAIKVLEAGSRILKSNGSRMALRGDQTLISLMCNGYVYPTPEWIVSPYIGLGLGATEVSWNDVSGIDDSDTVFTYQVIVGAAYEITKQISLEADYRYFAPSDADIMAGVSAGNIADQELNVISIYIKHKL